jgi:phosphatidate cytidylyltransferase
MPSLFTLLGLEPAVAWSCLGIFGLIGGFAITIAVSRRLDPQRDISDLAARVRSWAIFVGVIVLALVAGPYGLLALFALFSLMGLRELLALGPAPVGRPLTVLTTLALLGQYGLLAAGQFGASWVFIPLVMGLLVPIVAMFSPTSEGYARRVGIVQLALLFAVFGLSHLPALLLLPGIERAVAGGRGLFVYVIFLTQFNDVAQYVWGKLVGTTPIVPALSPKKTWSGFLGGVLTIAGVSWLLAPVLTPIPSGWALLVGAAMATLGFMGDLTISALKRDVGAKDTGTLLPGFGGVMDRLDSLIYVAPALFAAVWLWWLP